MLKNLLGHATETILLEAVHAELYASNLYKHLANQCQRVGLLGAAKFFLNESDEELKHYQKLANYFNDRGSVSSVPGVEAFENPIRSLQEAFTLAYDTEVNLNTRYAKWYSTVLPYDPTTAQFLLQFLEIQRGSIGELGDFLSRIQLAGNDGAAILLLDKELGG